MRVILDIPEENLQRLGELAKFQKRSRKAFMELVLINHSEQAENNDVVSNKPQGGVKIQNLNKPTNTKELPVNGLKTVDATKKPIKLPNESGIDYAIRLEEWKQSQ